MSLRIALLAALCAAAGVAQAECLDWNAAAVRSLDGRIEALPGAGTVDYRLAMTDAGFGAQHEALQLVWRDAAGAVRAQSLFDRIGIAGPPVLSVEDDLLVLRLRECDHQGPCRWRTERYGYDHALARFTGVASWSGWEFDDSDGAPVWRRIDARAPEPVEASACDTGDPQIDTAR